MTGQVRAMAQGFGDNRAARPRRRRAAVLLSTTAMVAAHVVVALTATPAHASCAPATGDIVCSADDLVTANWPASVTRLTVDPGVSLATNAAIYTIRIAQGGAPVTSVVIGAGASVSGGGRNAIYSLSSISSFVNNGTLTGGAMTTGNAVYIDSRVGGGNTHLVNNGTIRTIITGTTFAPFDLRAQVGSTATITNSATGLFDGQSIDWAALALGNQDDIVENHGTMLGGRYGVLLYDGDDRLTNTGTISVTNPVRNGATDHAITSRLGQDVVTNSGILASLNAANGGVTVSLADGDDTFEVQAGSQIWSDAARSVTGIVDGGADTDTLRLNRAGTQSVDFGDFINFEIVDVVQGTVAFSGTTAASASFASGTVARGTGTFGGLTLQSGASLQPGNSIGTINTTTANFATGSSYDVEIDSAGNSDLLNATGTVTIASGVTLNITPETFGEDGSTYGATTDYTIITAGGGVTGTFDTVTDNFAFLDPTVTYDPNNVFLRMTRNSTTFSSVALTPNQSNASGAAARLGGGSPINTAITGLTVTGARAAYDQLSGEIHASNRTLLLGDSRSALQAARHHRADPEEHRWVRITGARSEFDGDGNAARAVQTRFSAFGGQDFSGEDGLDLGVMAGYTRSDIDVDARNSSGSAEGFHAGLYGATRAGDFDMSFGAIYAQYDLETTRRVSFGGFGDTLKADYDASSLTLFGEISKTYETARGSLEPFAGLSWTRLETDAFRETGGLAALSAAARSQDMGAVSLGLRGTRAFGGRGTRPVRLSGSLGWEHRIGDVSPRADLAFAGEPSFPIRGVNTARNLALASVGLEIDLRDNMRLAIDYNGEFGRNYSGHRAEVSLVITF